MCTCVSINAPTISRYRVRQTIGIAGVAGTSRHLAVAPQLLVSVVVNKGSRVGGGGRWNGKALTVVTDTVNSGAVVALLWRVFLGRQLASCSVMVFSAPLPWDTTPFRLLTSFFAQHRRKLGFETGYKAVKLAGRTQPALSSRASSLGSQAWRLNSWQTQRRTPPPTSNSGTFAAVRARKCRAAWPFRL